MKKSNFKTGDRVTRVDDFWGGPPTGTTGTVLTDKRSILGNVVVAFDNWDGGHDGSPNGGPVVIKGAKNIWFAYPSSIELIREKK